MVEELATGTRDLSEQAEQRLLGIIARQLADGLDAPGWGERKLSAVQAVRRASQAVVGELAKATTLEVFDVVTEAYNVGHRAAVAEVGALSDDARRLVDDVTPGAQAVDRLAQETVDRITATYRSILRAVDDRYRGIVAEVTATPLLGTGTRRQATQDAMQRFADEGIRSFTDRAGRKWQLTSYAEMAVRTSVGRAATEAHMRTLDTAGVELVIVSNAPRECPLCRPWEGRVLAIRGAEGARTVEAEHAIEDGRMVPVKVAGTLSAYTPGLTRTEDAESDPGGYEAGQRQRAIERNIRKHKARAAAVTVLEPARKFSGKRTHRVGGRDSGRYRHAHGVCPVATPAGSCSVRPVRASVAEVQWRREQQVADLTRRRESYMSVNAAFRRYRTHLVAFLWYVHKGEVTADAREVVEEEERLGPLRAVLGTRLSTFRPCREAPRRRSGC
ncbi:phage minor capsid protein [Streptomyces sp. NPDC005146]